MTSRTYTTLQGDAFDAIAFRLWGEERMFLELILANPEHRNMLMFPAGVVLRVPEVPARVVKQELPPWF